MQPFGCMSSFDERESWAAKMWEHNGLCVGVSGRVPRELFARVGVWGLLNLRSLSVEQRQWA
jgi:hypothetical protein